MTGYQLELLENIIRNARHGAAAAAMKESDTVDFFQQIYDEALRIKNSEPVGIIT